MPGDERFVSPGDVITSARISKGNDMALHVVGPRTRCSLDHEVSGRWLPSLPPSVQRCSTAETS